MPAMTVVVVVMVMIVHSKYAFGGVVAMIGTISATKNAFFVSRFFVEHIVQGDLSFSVSCTMPPA